jgi:hypothetical protein
MGAWLESAHGRHRSRLSADYVIRVSMSGQSDSTQAGFAIGPQTMRRLGMLSAALFGDIYLDEDL